MTAVLITGASSGIGAALARAYARPGATLSLSGRDEVRLETVAARCRALGAEVRPRRIDVTDRAAMAAWVEGAGPLDLVVANAGISAGTAGGDEGEEQTRRIVAVNVEGVMNTVLPALPAMRARRLGQVALMSSLAGFRGYPGAPAYCASKAMVRVWGEALRGWLGPEGIGVSVICPGFVTTPMTAANRFPMPFRMDADRAAAIIKRGLDADRGRIAFPWPTYAASLLAATLPAGLMDAIAKRMPKK
jgi:NADP-dependent 3-hydroxy acid dehydrogenase YdfG